MPAHARPAVLTPDQLAAIGTALYGAQWHSDLARALGISRQSVEYMLRGVRPVHAGIASDLAAICRGTADSLARWAEWIEAELPEEKGGE